MFAEEELMKCLVRKRNTSFIVLVLCGVVRKLRKANWTRHWHFHWHSFLVGLRCFSFEWGFCFPNFEKRSSRCCCLTRITLFSFSQQSEYGLAIQRLISQLPLLAYVFPFSLHQSPQTPVRVSFMKNNHTLIIWFFFCLK